MKHLLWLLLVGIVAVGMLLVGCTGGGGPDKIRVATDATWAPFEYVDTETEEIVGFDIDLFDAIALRANLTVEYINVEWDALLAGMAQGTYDAAISSITIKPDRLEKMNFSHPYFTAGQIIVILQSTTDITGPETLAGKLVGVQAGTTGDDLATSINGTEVRRYDDIPLAFAALMADQIDAVICDTPVAYGYVDKYAILLVLGEVLTTEEYGIAVPKGEEELLEKINTALDELLDEGIIEELTTKWLRP